MPEPGPRTTTRCQRVPRPPPCASASSQVCRCRTSPPRFNPSLHAVSLAQAGARGTIMVKGDVDRRRSRPNLKEPRPWVKKVMSSRAAPNMT